MKKGGRGEEEEEEGEGKGGGGGGRNNVKNLPHMMPSKNLFAKIMDLFPITPFSIIIIYTTKKQQKIVHFTTSRAYYIFNTFCQYSNKLYLIPGALSQEWIDDSGPIKIQFLKSLYISGLDDFLS